MASEGASRLGDWELADVEGEVKLLLDHERRWRLELEVRARPFVIPGDEGEDDEEDDEPEPVSPRIGLDCQLDVDDWHALEGRSLRLEGDAGNGWIQLFDYEAIWDVTLTFGHAVGDRIRVSLEARACEDWKDRPFLPLSFDAVLTLAGDAAPRVPDRSAECPAGRKACRACGAVSFEVTPTCPTCHAATWWHE